MKNLKKDLVNYLTVNSKTDEVSYTELYNMFPFDGNNLSTKQKSDRVRSIWKRLRRSLHKPSSPAGKVYKTKQPKILMFDLETSPLLAYVWRIWKQDINPTNGQLAISENMILSWSAKWLYEEEVMNDWMLSEEIIREDDSRVCESLWKLINEADVIVAHNANGFDVKLMNGRFLKNGLHPPSHYQVIDTLGHVRKKFRLVSTKLDYVAQFLGMGSKNSTSFGLWINCMKGDEDAMKEMVEYCDQDVRLLEAVYLKIRPWIMPHPNFNVIVDSEDTMNCPTCGSTKHKKQGFYTTYANKYQQHKCNSCHSTFRSRKAIKFDKTNLTIATPN